MMEATHIIKPEGCVELIQHSTGNISVWYKVDGQYKLQSMPAFDTPEESVKFHNAFHSKAPKVYGYE